MEDKEYAEAISLSNGCCLSSRRKTAILPGFKTLERFPLEAIEGPERRNAIFANCWDTIEKKINGIISSHHDKVVQDILLFISMSKEKLDMLHDTTQHPVQSEFPIIQNRKLLELFTAALVAGVSMPDHQLLFEQLLVEIRKNSSPYVVLLRARECNSGMRATMKCILTQLMFPADQAISGSEDEGPPVWPVSSSKDKTPRSSTTKAVKPNSDSDEESPYVQPASASKNIITLRSKKKLVKLTAAGKDDATSSQSRRQVVISTIGGKDKILRPTRKITRSTRGSSDETPRTRIKIIEASSESEEWSPPPTKKKRQSTSGSGLKTPPSTKKVKRLERYSEELKTLPSKKEMGRPTSACRTPRSAKKRSVKLPSCSMNVLCSWYLETSEASACRPPVVLIVEDFEEFSPNILQDLILSITSRLLEFPVVLVLGVATSTSVNTLYHTFPQHVTSCLSISQFHTQQPSLTLAQIVTDVLIAPNLPFKLGPRALQFLLHQFSHWNFSLTCFNRGLKLAVMEHFYWQPLSILCSYSTLTTKCWPEKMTRSFCEAVRSTPSFQRYVESLKPVRRLSLLEKDYVLKSEVKELVHSLDAHQRTSYPLLRCLHHLTRGLPGAPLGHQLHELYSLSLEKNLVEQSKFAAAWTLVSKQSKEQLCASVALCSAELRAATDTNADLCCWQDALGVCEVFEQEVKHLDKAVSKVGCEALTLTSASRQETTSERKMVFHEHLRQINSRRSEPNAFEDLRGTFLSSMLLILAEHLHAPCMLPLHEAFYFDHVSSLHKHLAPSPRATLLMALVDPWRYLAVHDQDPATTKEEGTVPPDLCTAYGLYLECGKLINLYDWLQSFVAIVQPDAMEEEENGKKSVDSVLYARFTQAVCELQVLGFIKQTQRKTDHVQRLMWDVC